MYNIYIVYLIFKIENDEEKHLILFADCNNESRLIFFDEKVGQQLHWRMLTSCPLQVDVDERWSAEQLLSHDFLKMAAENRKIVPLINAAKTQLAKQNL